jgi:hypothetical protein
VVDRLERIHVVLLELDSPIDKLSDVGVDVGRPEAHLGVIGFVAAAAAVDPALGRSPRSLLGRVDVLLANGRIENVQQALQIPA